MLFKTTAKSSRSLLLALPAVLLPVFLTACASDADDEVRGAVRTVIDAVRDGTSLDRIAVLHASVEPYGRLLHDHLSAAGVATNGSAAQSVGIRGVWVEEDPTEAIAAVRRMAGFID